MVFKTNYFSWEYDSKLWTGKSSSWSGALKITKDVLWWRKTYTLWRLRWLKQVKYKKTINELALKSNSKNEGFFNEISILTTTCA